MASPGPLQTCAFAWLALFSACAGGADGELPDPGVDAGTVLVEAGPPPSPAAPVTTSTPPPPAREDASRPASAPSSSSSSGTTSSASSGTPATSSSTDAGTRPTSAATASGTPSQNEIDSLIDALLGASDAGSNGAPSGEWKLQPDSAPECPADPPPIPIIGGPCLGIYYMCGWKNPAGEIYTCTCDWVHWLCI